MNTDRFNDDHGWAGCRPDIEIDWRDMPDPEDLEASKPVYFVGYFVFVLHQSIVLGQHVKYNDRYGEDFGEPLPIDAHQELYALDKWLNEASEYLPEWTYTVFSYGR